MMEVEGILYKNDLGRWEFEGHQLTSGDGVEIEVDELWLSGFIESWGGQYHWFSRKDGIEVVLLPGMKARTPRARGERAF